MSSATTTPPTTPRPAPPVPAAPLVAAGLVLLAVGAAALAAWATGAVRPLLLPGITVSDGTVLWLLPTVVAAAQAAQVLTLGALLAAAVLFPAERGELSPAGWYAARTAARAGAAWAVLAVLLLPLTTADLLGQPLGGLSARAVGSTAFSVATGREYVLVAAAALVCAVVGATALTRRVVLVGLLAGVVAIAAQASAGHSSASGDHQVAVSSLFLHLLGVVAWAGGLVALVVLARRLPTAALAVAARRFSPLAAVAALVVTASGVVNALVRLGPDPGRWGETAYGPLVAVKLAATVGLLGFGAWHRRRTLRPLAGGDRRAFVRLALGETALFGVVLGLAAALSRTAPPPTGRVESATESTLGFALPPPVGAARLVLDVYPEPVFLALAVAAVAGYGLGVRRLRRAGSHWPAHRTVAWCAGWLLVLALTGGGIARYAFVLTTAHVGQYLLLVLVAAPLIAAGAPLALALRTATPQAAPRLQRAAGAVTHPAVVAAAGVALPFVLYLTPLHEAALRDHWWHLTTLAVALAVGVAFAAVVLAVDPLPRPPSRAVRVGVAAACGLALAAFGVLLARTTAPLVPGWWADLARPWGPTPLADTRRAGTLCEVAGVVLAVVGAGLAGRRTRADARSEVEEITAPFHA